MHVVSVAVCTVSTTEDCLPCEGPDRRIERTQVCVTDGGADGVDETLTDISYIPCTTPCPTTEAPGN